MTSSSGSGRPSEVSPLGSPDPNLRCYAASTEAIYLQKKRSIIVVFCSKWKGRETEKMWRVRKKQQKRNSNHPSHSYLVCPRSRPRLVQIRDGPNPGRFAKAQEKRDKDLTHHFLCFFFKNLSYMAGALQIQSNPFFPTRVSAPPREQKRAVLMTQRDG